MHSLNNGYHWREILCNDVGAQHSTISDNNSGRNTSYSERWGPHLQIQSPTAASMTYLYNQDKPANAILENNCYLFWVLHDT